MATGYFERSARRPLRTSKGGKLMRRGLFFGALAALGVLLCACAGADTPETDPTEAEDTTQTADASELRTLLSGHMAEFRLVRPEDCSKTVSDAMKALSDAIDALEGAHPAPVTDFEAFYEKTDCEIVFGKTTRTEAEPYASRLDALGAGQYELALDADARRVYLLFTDEDGMYAASEALLREVYPEKDAAAVYMTALRGRGLARYSLTVDGELAAGIVLPSDAARTFSGTTVPGASVTFSLQKDGETRAEATTAADAAGIWEISAALPQEEGDGYRCIFAVNGWECASYDGISLGEIGAFHLRDMSLTVDGAPVRLYDNGMGPQAVVESAQKTVRVCLTYARNLTVASVLPASAGIAAETDGQTLTFDAPVPAKLVVELNGNSKRSLQLFLYEPDSDVPEAGENVLYFAPGEYTYADPIVLTSGQTVYLEYGSVVHAKFEAKNAENITIRGRGVIDTYGMEENTMLRFENCQNVALRDYTLCGPRKWMTLLRQCDGVTVDGVNIIGTQINSDGIDIVGSRNVDVRNAYICANDDCIAVKSLYSMGQSDVENVRVSGCVLWNQEYGNGIEIGYETCCTSIRDIVFEDIDLIHVTAGAALSIHVGDRAHVSDVTYRDIRIADAHGALAEMFIRTTRYTQDDERGRISGITFDGIHVADGAAGAILLEGFDEAHGISDVSFSNVTAGGKPLGAADIASFKRTHAKNISWDGEALDG